MSFPVVAAFVEIDFMLLIVCNEIRRNVGIAILCSHLGMLGLVAIHSCFELNLHSETGA